MPLDTLITNAAVVPPGRGVERVDVSVRAGKIAGCYERGLHPPATIALDASSQ